MPDASLLAPVALRAMDSTTMHSHIPKWSRVCLDTLAVVDEAIEPVEVLSLAALMHIPRRTAHYRLKSLESDGLVKVVAYRAAKGKNADLYQITTRGRRALDKRQAA